MKGPSRPLPRPPIPDGRAWRSLLRGVESGLLQDRFGTRKTRGEPGTAHSAVAIFSVIVPLVLIRIRASP